MEIYNVKLESSEIVLADEEVAVLNEYKEQRISVTELCEKFAQYGLQVVRLDNNFARLQMDVTNGKTEAIISFEVELGK